MQISVILLKTIVSLSVICFFFLVNKYSKMKGNMFKRHYEFIFKAF